MSKGKLLVNVVKDSKLVAGENPVPENTMATQTAVTATNRRYSGFDGQYVNGSWRPGRQGRTLKDTDPYSSETLAEIALANPSDLDEAYRSAAKAQAAWAVAPPSERASVMFRAAALMDARHEEIVDWLIRESGSTRIKAETEWQYTRSVTLEAATFPRRVEGRLLPVDDADKESRAYRQPLGVIGVISPWNFPLYLSQRSVAPALALGNAVVVKPSQETPITGGLLIAKIYEEAGLPPGLLNIVVGASTDIGDAFTLHPIPRLISFTGSTPVGRQIGALAATGPMMKRVALELGGNAPCVILNDADLDHAVPEAVLGRFFHQGQICISTNRIIVDASLHDEFVDRFVAQVRQLKVGNPSDPDTIIGPVINEKQLKSHLAHIKGARASGARQKLGGDPVGLVLPPHVFLDVTNDMPIAQEEMFGPIAPIIKVNDEAEALRTANETQFGLSSAVFTRDTARGVRFALGLQAGMTHVNGRTTFDAPSGPFGGEKNSGLGRFGGDWILREFTADHWVTVQHSQPASPN